MKRVALSCCSLLAVVALLGCEKKPDAPAPASDTPVAAAPAPAEPDKPIAATVTVDLEKVAVEEQFEKEVEAEVTPANFEKQLEALEKEVKAQ